MILRCGDKDNLLGPELSQVNVLILCIATSLYAKFLPRFLKTYGEKFLPNAKKTFLIFSDKLDLISHCENAIYKKIKHKAFPYGTLLRYEHILSEQDTLLDYDWVVYADADTYCNDFVSEQEFLGNVNSLFGVKHPWYQGGKIGPFEINKKSFAFVSDILAKRTTYIQGCLWGGRSLDVFNMISELRESVREDLKKGIIAVLHDESHLNRYNAENSERFYYHHCGYSYPEGWSNRIPQRIIHVNENTLKTLIQE